MNSTETRALIDPAVILALLQAADDKGRASALRKHHLLNHDGVLQLNAYASQQLRIDTNAALAIAESAQLAARAIHDRQLLADSYRIQANVHAAREEYQRAADLYQSALELFEELHDNERIARTLTAAIQPQIILGDYTRAFALASRAQQLFRELHDERRLARLENNVGNIYHRQDRFDLALAHYEHAYRCLLPFGDTEELTISLNNMSMCLIAMNDFPRALASYSDAKKILETRDLPLIRLTVDYNIAYLHYLRGNYRLAIDLLKQALNHGEVLGHSYLVALCYLDLSDIYVELNLSVEADAAAERGGALFAKLGIGYEAAKCLANRAFAAGQEGKTSQSLALFSEAKTLFQKEQNEIWPRLAELYQALVLFHAGRFDEARAAASTASAFFDHSPLHSKSAIAHLLLARIAIKTNVTELARIECSRAAELLQDADVPNLRFQVHFLRGEIEHACGNLSAARSEYQLARSELESLRANLNRDELKISFMKHKAELYERLVELCLSETAEKSAIRQAFEYIELAKSRSLMELLAGRGHPLPENSPVDSEHENRRRELQQELAWYHHRIDQLQLRSEKHSGAQLENLRAEAAVREKAIVSLLADSPRTQDCWSQSSPDHSSTLENIQSSLSGDTVLLEYYFAGETVHVVIVRSNSLEIVPVARVPQVTESLRMLRFQLSRMQFTQQLAQTNPSRSSDVVTAHLRDLYSQLIAPIRARLTGSHLVVVPHGALHHLPFHALHDGDQFLIDSHSISYAPSASVFALCQSRRAGFARSSLVFGIPDEQAPLIRQESEAVCQALPGSQLFLGADATHQQLSLHAGSSRIIHIATHGYFRPDNPMFSAIRLGDGNLYLYELYQMKLPADLLTLSGCATGLNVVSSGDELLGLIRGGLAAGVRSLLLTLWDVNDHSTSGFMASFYRRLPSSRSKAEALAEATREIRAEFPHPYFWAPFILVGNPTH